MILVDEPGPDNQLGDFGHATGLEHGVHGLAQPMPGVAFPSDWMVPFTGPWVALLGLVSEHVAEHNFVLL